MGLPNIGPVELIIVLVIALLILGPGKLPEVGSAFGKTIREFRKASSDIQETASVATAPVKEAASSVTAAAAAPVTPAAPAPAVAAADPASVASASAETAAATAPVAPAGTPVDAVDRPA
jgi:TatA/E family protein of Tat protein translocase